MAEKQVEMLRKRRVTVNKNNSSHQHINNNNVKFWFILLLVYVLIGCAYGYHNDTNFDEFIEAIEENNKQKSDVPDLPDNTIRVLTWNIKKMSQCLNQDNSENLRQILCTVIQSASIVALQEAGNLNLSCLPCAKNLKENYQWNENEPGVTQDFKLLVRTKEQKVIKLLKEGTCDKLGPPILPSKQSKEEKPIRESLTFNPASPMKREKDSRLNDTRNGSSLHGNTYLSQDATIASFHDKNSLEEQISELAETPEKITIGKMSELLRQFDVDVKDGRKYPENIFEKTSLKGENDGESDSNYHNRINNADDEFGSKNHNNGGDNKTDSRNWINDGENENGSQNHVTKEWLTKVLNQNRDETKPQITQNQKMTSDSEEDHDLKSKSGSLISKDIPSGVTGGNMTSSNTNNNNDEASTTDGNKSLKDLQELLRKDKERLQGRLLNRKADEKYKIIKKQLNVIEEEIEELDRNEGFSKNSKTKNEDVLKVKDEKLKNENEVERVKDENGDEAERTKDRKLKSEKEEDTDIKNKYDVEIEMADARNGIKSDDENYGSSLSKVDLDSDRVKMIIKQVLSDNSSLMRRKELLSRFLYLRSRMRNVEDQISGHEFSHKKTIKRHDISQKVTPLKRKVATRQVKGEKRQQVIAPIPDPFRYKIFSVTSNDYNYNVPVLVVNVRLPKDKALQTRCIQAVIDDIKVSERLALYRKSLLKNIRGEKIYIMGDFHFDQMNSIDPGDFSIQPLHEAISKLSINGQTYHSIINYNPNDPLTTVFGRRYDNIITNNRLALKPLVVGPPLPIAPELMFLPLTLQRLYNNYMTTLYSGESNPEELNRIKECIKIFQLAGKEKLSFSYCQSTWVPSTYVSDHLPLEIRVKINEIGHATPFEMKFSSWNIQGETLKERLEDPEVRDRFVSFLSDSQVVIVNDYQSGNEMLSFPELEGGKLSRLKQGIENTEFGIYINHNNREHLENNVDEMFVLRRKSNEKGFAAAASQGDNLLSTVGLFTPNLVVDGKKILPCFYTLHYEGQVMMDFIKIIDTISQDHVDRKCHFKVLLAHLYLEDGMNLKNMLYSRYQYVTMDCSIKDGEKRYRYNVPRSRDLTDYVIVLDRMEGVKFHGCEIMLPGDENRRGIERLSDFEELSTHYPLSAMVQNVRKDIRSLLNVKLNQTKT